ncbi:MAG TPA: hypothetical protein VH761_01300 [Ilumatobacteraceae bacterium]|jgi:hypothetical protein
MTTPTSTRFATLGLTALVVLAACGSSNNNDSAAATSPAVTTPSTAAPEVSTPSTLSAGTPYSTTQFVEPLDLVVPSWLVATPAEDEAHFVTFASPDESMAIRILLPVVVYPPGQTGTASPPDDYVSYLLGQTDSGAQFTDRADTTVDGHAATVVTATTSTPIDGSLGCPDEGIEAHDCFGLQPEFILRLAVITTDAGPLLIWLRANTDDHPDMPAVSKLFDALLADVRFADRQPAADPAATAGPLDGTYTWTITKDDARAHGTPEMQTTEGLAFFPSTFTLTIDHGTWNVSETSSTDTGHGTVTATADHAEFHWDLDTFTFDIARDADGTLHLTPIDGLRPDDVFIWTVEPWTPVGKALEGTYSWTLTWDDATLDPNFDPSLEPTYPWTFSISMSDGTCTGYHVENTTRYEDGTCTYEATADEINFDWGSQHLAFNYVADADGTLHMTAIPPINSGDNYVTTTKPWIKQ